MNTSGEAAEQVMRMSLEGAEILIKLTGSGAKNAAVLLYSIYKEQNKTCRCLPMTFIHSYFA